MLCDIRLRTRSFIQRIKNFDRYQFKRVTVLYIYICFFIYMHRYISHHFAVGGKCKYIIFLSVSIFWRERVSLFSVTCSAIGNLLLLLLLLLSVVAVVVYCYCCCLLLLLLSIVTVVVYCYCCCCCILLLLLFSIVTVVYCYCCLVLLLLFSIVIAGCLQGKEK